MKSLLNHQMPPTITELTRSIQICKKCPRIVESRSKSVPGFGNKNAGILFVGLAPGKDGADLTGIPFTRDPSGLLIDEMCRKAGISREMDVFITNLVKCNPKDKKGRNRTPSKKEIVTCQLYLEKEIILLNPKLIVPLGKAASNFFLGKNDFSMKEIHGEIFQYKGRPIVPFIHPGYVIRGAFKKSQYIDEFKKVGKIYLDLIEKESRLSRFDLLLLVLKNSSVNGLDGCIEGKTRLQKFVFLAQDSLRKRGYSGKYAFRPYYYGPFNRQLYTDLEWLKMNDYIKIDQPFGTTGVISTYSITEKGIMHINDKISARKFSTLDSIIASELSQYSKYSIGDLVDYVHTEYENYNKSQKVKEDSQKKLDRYLLVKEI